MPVRSKQGALGSLRRADHPRPACILSVAISGRCVGVVSARRAASRDSFRLRWLELLAKSRPISLAKTSVIGRYVPKRKHGRAVARCCVQPLLSPFDIEWLSWQVTLWRSSFYGFLWPRSSSLTQSELRSHVGPSVLKMVLYNAFIQYSTIAKRIASRFPVCLLERGSDFDNSR
jgi:hypothetical protein